MQTEVQELSQVASKLKITVPKEEVTKAIDEQVVKLQKSVEVRGFRKGHVPLSMVRNLYLGSARANAFEEIVSHAFATAVTENNLVPVSRPQIDSAALPEEGKDFVFEATFEVNPKDILKNYKGFKIQRKDVNITDKDVDDELERYRQHFAKLNEISDVREVTDKDYGVIDYNIKEKDGTRTLEFKDMIFELGSSMDFGIGGLSENIKGMKKGDTKQFVSKYNESHFDKSWANKEIEVSATLKEIKQKDLPELNDEFAKGLGSFETMDALKKEIKHGLTMKAKEEAAKELRDSLIDQLVNENKFDVPASLVSEQSKHMVDGYLKSLMPNQAGKDKLNLKEEFMKTLEEKVRPEAEKIVKAGLLFREIEKVENIKVEDKDIDDYIRGLVEGDENRYQELTKTLTQRDKQNLTYQIWEKKIVDKITEYSS